jgi:hypothetical protein
MEDYSECVYTHQSEAYKLNVISVVSNPCLYKRRYKLAKEFIKRMENNDKINLYIVELCYENQKFMITESNNKNHLQLKTKYPLWHKENMINLGVKKLLPNDWKSFAWLDADIEIMKEDWVEETLKMLETNDVIQLFNKTINLDKNDNVLSYKTGFIYDTLSKYNPVIRTKENKLVPRQKDYHSGFAWAINRNLYEKMKGLFELSIIGGGDKIMANLFTKTMNEYLKSRKFSEKFIENLVNLDNNMKTFDVKYNCLNTEIKHYYHGEFENRKYIERFEILDKYNYDPIKYIKYDEHGLIQPSENCPYELLKEIYEYFRLRNEDEDFED